MRSLGEAGVVETETEALLIDNEVDFAEFSPEVEQCLPKESPWTIPRVNYMLPWIASLSMRQRHTYSYTKFLQ